MGPAKSPADPAIHRRQHNVDASPRWVLFAGSMHRGLQFCKALRTPDHSGERVCASLEIYNVAVWVAANGKGAIAPESVQEYRQGQKEKRVVKSVAKHKTGGGAKAAVKSGKVIEHAKRHCTAGRYGHVCSRKTYRGGEGDDAAERARGQFRACKSAAQG